MEISAALAADLRTLTTALDQPNEDIESAVANLATGLAATVDSYLGFTITTHAGGNPISFTVPRRAGSHPPVTGSFRISLTALGSGSPSDWLILYAANPGAFVDLAADLCWALDIDINTVILDADADTGIELTATVNTGLTELSMINQAIGALTEEGLTVEQAAVELQHRAEADRVTLHTAAARVMSTLRTDGLCP
ncbi:MAG: hypothetical protein JWN95_1107 [Frankiales bacterium]|nr:hypothetical protein [Frankiales bacterium]